jgi:proline iminopeptidase
MTGNDVWPRLAAHREVVFYDQRGTGQSKTTAVPLSQDLASYLEDLDAIRKDLKQPSVLVMGDSWGGFIAMAYAARYPEHVAKLILVDSVDSNWGNSLLLLDKVFPDRTPVNSSGEVTGDSLLASKASVTSYLSSLFYSQETFAEFMSAIPTDMGPENAVFDAIGKTMGEIDLTRELKNITAPTLVINGRFDMNEPVITAFNLSKRIAGAHLAIFEKSGHLPFYEEADLFVKTVDAYMASRP